MRRVPGERRQKPHRRRARTAASGLALAAALLLAGGANAISGVCPDGSIFIVQDPSAIPCPGAKRVDPNDMPPLAPEFLPRPYGWEVFNREMDPNNPYNLVDLGRPDEPSPRESGSLSRPPPAPGVGSQRLPMPPGVAPAPLPSVAAAPPPTPSPARPVELAENELRNLVAIIELLQDRAPATLVQRDADQRPGLQLRFARSAAFEAHLASVLTASGSAPAGPIVVYHVIAQADGAFWGNLTFVQGHVAFSPDPADPAQFGVIHGTLGDLRAGSELVGYAALPEHADPGQPLDVYWNDLLLTAVLAP